MIGALLARNLGVGLGDSVTILGNARDGSVAAGEVVITGIFETGQPEFDRGILYVPLPYFDEVYRMDGAVHRVIARSDSLWGLGPVADRVTHELADTGLPGHPPVALTWRRLLPGVLEAIELDMFVGVFMYVILVLVVAFSILNTFVMTVFERTREFGVMMAIGTTPWRLVRVLMLESGMLTLLGIAGGIVVGAIITAWVQRVGMPLGKEFGDMMVQYGLPPRIHPELSIWSATLGPRRDLRADDAVGGHSRAAGAPDAPGGGDARGMNGRYETGAGLRPARPDGGRSETCPTRFWR